MSKRPNQQDEPGQPAANRGGFSDDATLVEQAKAGDLSAFGRLVERYQDRIFNTCWRICGHHEDARDLTQDAFLKALDGIAAFRGESGFYTWLFRIAVNLALSHRRRAKGVRGATVSLDQLAGAKEMERGRQTADPDAVDPSRAVKTADLHERTLAALATLDDEHRAVIVLRDMEGLSYGEIGSILDVPVGTVKSRLHRGRLSIREAIEPPRSRQG